MQMNLERENEVCQAVKSTALDRILKTTMTNDQRVRGKVGEDVWEKRR